MPTVTAGLVAITTTCTFNDTEAQNVYYYWNQTNTPVLDLSAVLTAFDSKVFPDFAAVLGTAVSIDLFEARDVFGLLPDVTMTPTTTAGTVAGELLNNFSCVRINLEVSSKETRRGYKRIGGITEGSVAGNGLTTAFRTVVQDYADQLDDILIVGAENYQPVIYGGPTPSLPSRHVANPITGWGVPNRQFSQGSRKT